MSQDPTRLAAVIFENGDEADQIVSGFAAALSGAGVRLCGFVQISEENLACDCKDTFVLDLETGTRTKILQDLGKGSKGCRVDTQAIAGIAHSVSEALSRVPQLLIINRFGKLEAEGMGLRHEIAAAALSGVPTLVAVASRYADAWRLFAGDLCEELVCAEAELHMWWRNIETALLAEAMSA
jgi:hypothetical protein